MLSNCAPLPWSQLQSVCLPCQSLGAEEEADVVWFPLKKDVGEECSVCRKVFQVSMP